MNYPKGWGALLRCGLTVVGMPSRPRLGLLTLTVACFVLRSHAKLPSAAPLPELDFAQHGHEFLPFVEHVLGVR